MSQQVLNTDIVFRETSGAIQYTVPGSRKSFNKNVEC